MEEAYLTYAMSVIISRAIPDVRDGLKPVHRRILYTMYKMKLFPENPFKKCAAVVGQVLGSYHPHGDSSIYSALVRLAQDFSMRYPLIHGQGNFGSIDGDPAAANRYTEARMKKLAVELLHDIEKETVDMMLNYDDSIKEPVVLPSRIPNILLNGSSGIAVGMMTNIPPHNLSEIMDAVCLLIKNPNTQIEELIKHIKGPDFPTAGIIYGYQGILDMYFKGRGKIIVRARLHTRTRKSGGEDLVITELPYQVNKSELLSKIAQLVKDKKIEGISDIRDETNMKGLQVVIELKKGALTDLVINQLYAQTSLQVTFGAIMLALVNNEPQILDLKSILKHYIQHRKDCMIRAVKYDLDKAEKRLHIVLGLIKAIEDIQRVIQIIRSSKDVKEARKQLIEIYFLTLVQAQAILEMTLQRLTSLESQKLIFEKKELLSRIETYKSFLGDENKQYNAIHLEAIEIKKLHKDERKTEIIFNQELKKIVSEDLIPKETHAVIITKSSYIKRFPIDIYKRQKRGGVGSSGIDIRDDDITQNIFISSTHNYIAFFSNLGRVFSLKVYEIPLGSRIARGQKIGNILNLMPGEFIKIVLEVKNFNLKIPLILVTKNGIIKKSILSEFIHAKKRGIRCIKLDDNDNLVSANLSDGSSEFIVCTKLGLALRLSEKQIRLAGRSTRGVIAIRLKEGNEVIGFSEVKKDKTLLVLTQNGYGKRINFDSIKLKNRGGLGQQYIRINKKTGTVIDVKIVSITDEIMILTKQGKLIKTPVREISKYGKTASGLKIIQLKSNDRVVSIDCVKEDIKDV